LAETNNYSNKKILLDKDSNSGGNGFDAFKFNSEVFESYVAFDQDSSVLCCCKNDIPHDESMKFILKTLDPNMKMAPFKDQPAGKLIDENAEVKKNTNVHFD
jgi:hypothetical protein